jgi:hypothetical protein
MSAKAILRGGAAAIIVVLGTLSGASASHREHGHSYHGASPAMHGRHHPGPRMHRFHGRMHHEHHRHHAYGGRHRHHASARGAAFRQHRYHGEGYSLRPRLHGPRSYGGYGYRPRYHAGPAFHAVAPGYLSVDYHYPVYPMSSYGTVAGSNFYAPLYNRPACTCY